MKVLIDHGTLIEPEAVEYITSRKDPVGFVKKFLEGRSETPLVLTLADVRTVGSVLDYDGMLSADCVEPPGSNDTNESVQEYPEHLPSKKGPPPGESAAAFAQVKILMDITGNSTCDGSIENFTRYFRDRFRVLRRMIKSRMEMSGTIKITRARLVDRDVKVIGMVSDVGLTKNGHISITIEDDSDTLFVLIPKDSEMHSETILKDEVIGLVGRVRSGNRGWKGQGYDHGPGRGSDSMLIPKSIHRPDVPVNRAQRRSKENVEVVFLSDIHVGSSHFLPDAWKGFMSWLGSKDASRVRYAVVAGDLVDGIGIYPNQINELDIPDIEEQYAELARLMEPMPDNIEVLMQPGNHDAVRPAEPQPALPEELTEPFGDNFKFVGNPCYFSIEGVEILSYHGRSIDDLVGTVPGLKYQDPNRAMKEMLRRRHLAVSYGGRTPLAPEEKDYMVINPIPDIFVTGHVHRTSAKLYRNITMINASAWQSQTPFQLMHNFHPDPGKVIVVDLKTGQWRKKSFYEEEN